MLTALKNLGIYAVQNNVPLEQLVATDPKKQYKVLFVAIDSNSSPPNNWKIELEDFDDSKKLNLYVFERGSASGNIPSHFAQITEIEKTFQKKIYNWFKQFFQETKNDQAKVVLEILDQSKKQIIEQLKIELGKFNKKDTIFLSVKIDGKYLGEFGDIVNYLSKDDRAYFDGICSICGQKTEVNARSDAFQFDSFDKPGFITGGFKDDWKCFPVCKNCKDDLVKGKKFIEKYTNYRFYGLRYYVIPKFLIGLGSYQDEVLEFFWNYAKRDIKLKDKIINKITNDENEILEILSQNNDLLSFDILFLRADQAAERILLHIEDVMPSRLQRIFKAKFYVEDKFSNENFSPKFNFGCIRTFFWKTDPNKRDPDLDKFFLQIVDSVFKGREIDLYFLLTFFMNTLRTRFLKLDEAKDTVKNQKEFSYAITDAMMTICFLENLNLIQYKGGEFMEKSIFDSLYEKYFKSLNNYAKRAIFLLGGLTDSLLYEQERARSSKPFYKKLKSLKMDERDFRGLLPEIQNKFEEYNAFEPTRKIIAEEIARCFLLAGDNWNMPNEEMNFYFSCGMNLSREINDCAFEYLKSLKTKVEVNNEPNN